jgi:NADPH:quinone reductase-like Zn-dependent oxidoreductase
VIVHPKYGSPDVLELKEVEKPTPKDNEVLISIVATAVTTVDANFRKDGQGCLGRIGDDSSSAGRFGLVHCPQSTAAQDNPGRRLKESGY